MNLFFTGMRSYHNSETRGRGTRPSDARFRSQGGGDSASVWRLLVLVVLAENIEVVGLVLPFEVVHQLSERELLGSWNNAYRGANGKCSGITSGRE